MLTTCLLVALAQNPARFEIIVGGDVIPHDPVKLAARLHARSDAGGSQNNEGWDHIFGPVASLFRAADLAVVNVETPVTDNKKAITGGFLFNANSSFAHGLASAGVDVALFANNHALDQHREGIVETRQNLEAAGLKVTGSDLDEARAWLPLVVEIKGVRVGLLAFTRFLNGFHNLPDPKKPHVPLVRYDSDPATGGYVEKQALEKVRAAAALCDVLIVFPHWGDEYQTLPKRTDRFFAAAMVQAGATAIIGSHPHVLQPVETVMRPDGTEGVIAYSVGNLVSNQDWEDPDSLKRDGLLMRLIFERRVAGGPVTLVRAQPLPLWTENVLAKGTRRNVQPVVLDEEVAAMRERLRALEPRTDRVSRSEITVLQKRLHRASARRERILSVAPLELSRVE